MGKDDEPKNASTNEGEIHISKIARGEEAPENQEGDIVEGNLTVVNPTDTIIATSEQAWIQGTQSLQRNLLSSLQEYQTGWWAWRERGLLAEKRQQMINEVTQHYIRFLREEARISSDAALQARSAILQKQLFELKSGINKEIADMVGIALGEIESIFKTNFGKLTDPEIQKAYAEFVMKKIFDLLDIHNLK